MFTFKCIVVQLLWTKYFFHAELYSRNYDRLFVSFDSLVASPTDFAKKCKLFVNEDIVLNDLEIDIFIDKTMKHENIAYSNISNDIPLYVKNILNIMKADSLNKVTNHKFDSIRRDFLSFYEMVQVTDVVFNTQLSKDLHAVLSSKEQEIAELNFQVTAYTEQAQVFLKTNEELKIRIAELTTHTESLQAQNNELVEQKEQQEQQEQKLESQQQLQQQLQEQQAALQAANAEKTQEMTVLMDDLIQVKENKEHQQTQDKERIVALTTHAESLQAQNNELVEQKEQQGHELENQKKLYQQQQQQQAELQAENEERLKENQTLNEEVKCLAADLIGLKDNKGLKLNRIFRK